MRENPSELPDERFVSAVVEALIEKGQSVFDHPHQLLSFFLDYALNCSDTDVMLRQCDDELLRPFSHDGDWSPDELQEATKRVEICLTEQRQINESAARRIALGLAQGVAQWQGLDVGLGGDGREMTWDDSRDAPGLHYSPQPQVGNGADKTPKHKNPHQPPLPLSPLIPLAIVFVTSLLTLVFFIVLSFVSSQPKSTTQPADEAVVVETGTEEAEGTRSNSSHAVTAIEGAIRDTFRKDEEHALSYFGIAGNTEGGSFENATEEENFAKGCMRVLDVEAVPDSINLAQDGSTATASVEFTVVDLLAAYEEYESEVYPEQGVQLRVRPLGYVYERLAEEDYCQANTAPVPPGQVELTLSYQTEKGAWLVDDESLRELLRRARETMHYEDVVEAARDTMSLHEIESGHVQTQNSSTRTDIVSSDEATSAESSSSTQGTSSSYDYSATDETETVNDSSGNAH